MKSVRMLLGSVVALALLTVLVVYHSTVGTALQTARTVVITLFTPSISLEQFQSLSTENHRLQAEIDTLEQRARVLPERDPKFRTVATYSRYPLNDRERFVIDAGEIDGVTVGMPIFVPGGALVGRVVQMWRTRAEVQTIFDPEWRSSVRIGVSTAKAAFSGGNPPELSLISQDVAIATGDAVTNVSPDFPLGAYIGSVGDVRLDTNDVWKTATVRIPYTEELFSKVLIPVTFP